MKKNVEFRYYEIPDGELILPLLGPTWHKAYGEGPDRLHFHNYYEVGICYEGEGEMTLGEEVIHFCPGCISLIPPTLLHTTNTYGSKARWEWMYFDMASMLDYIIPDDEISRATIRYQLLEKAMFFFPEEKTLHVRNLLGFIFDSIENKSSYLYNSYIQYLMNAVVIDIIRLGKTVQTDSRKMNLRTGIEPAIEYVNNNYDTEIKISVLAEVCNMSESHFRRIFGKYMNMKPGDYINYIRIRKSCGLLRRTNMTIGDITSKIGYDSQGSFIRNFRNMIGMTPLQWRKAEREGSIETVYNITAKRGWME